MKDKVNCLLILLLSMLFSCKENSKSVELLTQSRNLLFDKPTDALILLDSIQNPELMDSEDYMSYIVTYVEAKLKTQQDISNDTLIYKAQEYYNNSNDSDKGAIANYISGRVSMVREKQDMALASFLKAEYDAHQSNNDPIIAKSLHSIANLYYYNENTDTAIVRYKEAYQYYIKLEGTENNQILVLQQIGRTYNDMNSLDSALVYLHNGLELAKKRNNQAYETSITHLVGTVLREKGEYQNSKEYLNRALKKTKNEEESLRVHLSLARLYLKMQENDSVLFHIDEIKKGLSKINDNLILRSIYTSLADFYALNSDCNEVSLYYNLIQEVNKKISDDKGLKNLMNVQKEHQLYQKNEEIAKGELKFKIVIILSISMVLILTLIIILIVKNNRLKHQREEEKSRKEQEKSRLLETENEFLKLKVENLSFVQGIYQNIIHDWDNVENEIKELAVEFGADEYPELINKIKHIIEDLKKKSNNYLIENAKIYLRKSGVKNQIIKHLTDKQLLIFILNEYGYCKKDMLAIINLGEPIDEDNIEFELTAIRKQLKKYRL
ncbi:M48 family metallopeptidase [Dysgonomonas sp. ZJ709]|uniref:tetratricopeptide repeat protein n=1 Tax=Dysgonomonas sp. ZJ709 TaxID=2709797 RepID=UPI0013EB4614|nr:hypothetical protein [Dysgonomonas sp. ZJ709]